MLSSTAHDLLVIASLQPNSFNLNTLQTITAYTNSEIDNFIQTVLQQNFVDTFIKIDDKDYQFSSITTKSLWEDRIGELYDKQLYKKIFAYQQAIAQQRLNYREEYWFENITTFLQLTKDNSLSSDDLRVVLQRITEILSNAVKVSRASIWRYQKDNNSIVCLDLYEQTYHKHTRGTQLFAKDFPAYFNAISTKDYIKADNALTNPDTCEFTEVYLKPLGISSMLDIPFFIDGQLGGIICFEHQGTIRNWQSEDILFTVSMSAMVSLAYASLKSKEAENIAKKAHEEVVVLNEELHQQQEEIIAQRDLISERNLQLELSQAQINSSIRAAQLIQEAIMPTDKLCEKLLGEHFVILLPKDIVSGDFYWLHQDQQRTFLVVADCTGHGVAGAFMSLLGYSLLNYIIKEKQIVTPHEILETLHNEVQLLLRQNETGNVDGMDASIVVIDKTPSTHRQIAFCGAKRPLYYFEAGVPIIRELQADRKSIGGKQPAHRQFHTQYLDLPFQSVCYLFSDGYADQNNFQRERLGVQEFKETLTTIHLNAMSQQKEKLLEILHQHTQNTTQRDDILVIGLRVS